MLPSFPDGVQLPRPQWIGQHSSNHCLQVIRTHVPERVLNVFLAGRPTCRHEGGKGLISRKGTDGGDSGRRAEEAQPVRFLLFIFKLNRFGT